MSIEASRVDRVRVYAEPNGSAGFGVDHTGTMGDFKTTPIIEGSLQFNMSRPSESPLHAVQHVVDYNKEVLLPKTATMSFSMNIETVDTKATNGVTIAQSPLGRMLAIGMGGEDLGTGNTVNGTSATTTIIALTDASNFSEGGGIAFASGASGELEVREILAITGNTVNLKIAVTTAPSNTDTAYGTATYYLGATDGDTITSYQIAVEGQEQDDRWVFMGGQLSGPPTVELAPGGIGKINFQMTFARWDNADGTATTGTLTGSELNISTYADNVPLVIADSEYRLCTVGTTTLTNTLLHPSAMTFAPNFSYVPVRTPAGINTILQFCPTRPSGAPIAGQFTLPFEDLTHFTSRDSRTDKAMFFQIGSSATEGACLLTAPTVQLKEPNIDGSSGIQNQTVQWVGRSDISQASLQDKFKTPFRVHFV